VDHVVADKFPLDKDGNPIEVRKETTSDVAIPAEMMGLDIGPKTIEIYTRAVAEAGTVVWNGPMGVFEDDRFDAGTRAVAEALAGSDAVSILGGGDTAAAANRFDLGSQMTHISTGGGASLEYLEGRELPGIAVLNDKK